MTDLFESFKSLDINGGEITSLLIEPRAKIVIEISRIMPSLDYAHVHELQFYQTIHSAIQLGAKPWLQEIINHHLYDNSQYALDCLEKEKSNIQDIKNFRHFKIELQDRGNINIFAKNFTFITKKVIQR